MFSLKLIKTTRLVELAKSLHSAGILHEITHTAALHTPFERGSDRTDEEWARQEKFGIPVIQDLHESNEQLLETSVFNKNLMKALHLVRCSNDKVEVTENVVRITSTLKTYCDRFGMFLFQNYFKLQSYRSMLEQMGDRFTGQIPQKADDMYALDEIRQAGQLQEVGFTADEVAELERQLDADTKRHPYVQIGDPPILPQEEVVYRQNWELMHNYAQEGKFGIFSKEHFASSPFINLHNHPKYGIQDAEADFVTLVDEAMNRGLHPLAALATVTAETNADC